MENVFEVTPEVMDEYLYGDFIHPLHPEGSFALLKGRTIGYAFEENRVVVTVMRTHRSFGTLDQLNGLTWVEMGSSTYGYVVPRLAIRDEHDRLVFMSLEPAAVIIHP